MASDHRSQRLCLPTRPIVPTLQPLPDHGIARQIMRSQTPVSRDPGVERKPQPAHPSSQHRHLVRERRRGLPDVVHAGKPPHQPTTIRITPRQLTADPPPNHTAQPLVP